MYISIYICYLSFKTWTKSDDNMILLHLYMISVAGVVFFYHTDADKGAAIYSVSTGPEPVILQQFRAWEIRPESGRECRPISSWRLEPSTVCWHPMAHWLFPSTGATLRQADVDTATAASLPGESHHTSVISPCQSLVLVLTWSLVFSRVLSGRR